MKWIDWWLSLTPHQLDVIRTFASVVTGVFGGILIPLLGWLIRLTRSTKREAEASARQTRREERIDGKLYTVSVSEDTNQAVNNTSDLRAELLGPRMHGRRRDTPTNPVPSRKERQ